MLDFEETLQDRLNDAGVVATAEASSSSTPMALPSPSAGQVHHQGAGREGLPDPLRRRHPRTPRLSKPRGRPD